MTLLILSFVAGILTVAAPCILPLLPVVLGKSLINDDDKQSSINDKRPLIITASLVVSIIVFTLLLKASTALLGIPNQIWQYIAGGIITFLGFSYLFPSAWDKIPLISSIYIKANKVLGESHKEASYRGDVVTGMALGPIFNSCSPTYAFVVAAILPVSFAQGMIYLGAYAIGVGATLLAIAYAGQAAVKKLGWVSSPGSVFRRVIAVILIIVGLFLIFGIDKQFQEFVLERGWYDPILRLEQAIGH